MTVAQLVDELRCFPEDSEVHFAYNYGDHWHTQVAPAVRSVTEGAVEYSEYHRMPKVVDMEYPDDLDDRAKQKLVVILDS